VPCGKESKACLAPSRNARTSRQNWRRRRLAASSPCPAWEMEHKELSWRRKACAHFFAPLSCIITSRERCWNPCPPLLSCDRIQRPHDGRNGAPGHRLDVESPGGACSRGLENWAVQIKERKRWLSGLLFEIPVSTEGSLLARAKSVDAT